MKSLESQKTKLKSQDKPLKGSLLMGCLIATVISATPFIFNLYESVPEVKIWETFLFTYESKYYGDVSIVVWTLMNKFIPVILLLIWFFTCRHWWYHALIIPLAMYVYQIILTINSDTYLIDDKEILYLLPIMAVIVPSIYLIKAQMFDKLNNADKSLEELEEEFKIKPKSVFQKLGDYF